MFRKKVVEEIPPTRPEFGIPVTPQVYPRATFVKTEAGYFYIAGAGKRFRIISQRTLDSWAPPRVVVTSEIAVSNYKIISRMTFRNGSLICGISDGKIYLIENGMRRLIVSPDALDRLNATREDIITVSDKELELHQEGDTLA